MTRLVIWQRPRSIRVRLARLRRPLGADLRELASVAAALFLLAILARLARAFIGA